jgi:hypothetical protein
VNDEIGPVSSEAELQRKLKSYFEKHNWLAVREVSPTDSRVKADLIVKHDTYGWFGIETKYFNNDGGGKVADAHHQIVSKYRGKRYINDRINLWAASWRQQYTRELFCKHGVGYVNPRRNPLLIDFAYSVPTRKVPVDTNRETRHHTNVDIEEIRSVVKKKCKL